MARDLNVFSNIVRDENGLSELFCNLLQFKSFKTLFVSLLEEKLKLKNIDFEYSHIKTQNSLGDYGIPDVSIENDGFSLFIECKINERTALTNNQPVSYLKNLEIENSSKEKALVFILPDDYVCEKELLSRQNKFFDHNKSSEIRFAILYWHQILEYIQRAGIAELNPLFQHFSNLLRDWFSTRDINFNEEEVIMLYSKEIPKTYLELTDLVEEVKNKLSKSYKLNREINENGNGFYIKDGKGKLILYFGVWYQYWQEKEYPLVLAVCDEFGSDIVKKFQNKFKKKALPFDEDSWYVYGLPKELVSDQNNIKRIITLLNETLEYIKK